MSDLAARFYFSAAVHLWGALSFSDEGPYDDAEFHSPDSTDPLFPYGEYNELLMWAGDEYLDVWSELDYSINPEVLATNFAAEVLPALWDDARHINALISNLTKGRWLLVVYYQSVARVLEQFDALMREPLIEESPLQEHYFKKLETFNLLKAALLDAHPIPKEYETNAELRNLIDECTGRFASTWERMVREAARPDVSA